MPHIEEKIMHPVSQKLICDNCNNEMEMKRFNPQSGFYHYYCEKCGCIFQSKIQFPRTVFVEGTPITNAGLSWRSCEEIKKHGIKTVEALIQEVNHIDFPSIVKLEVMQMLAKRGLITNGEGNGNR